ncbi:helix-turn-helix domain-containing protein [Bacillus alveayuensis]|uniref:helix-turn-helix domain-containing protein n=1 Tax=Aeribacillus alveayuensis TaxID=279215 RepID=UPI0005D11251|nr:helix-turn-helix domain-containing protein [Bacillus alveayuensis]
MNDKLDVLLHPVRIRIIQCLIGGKKKSAQEIYEMISDIPRTTVYRQVNILYNEGILDVVDEKQVRGTVERFYQLALDGASLSNKDLQSLTKEEHAQLFFSFLMKLYQDFLEYIQKGEVDFIKDGVGYRTASFLLDDGEFEEMVKELNEVFLKYINKSPDENRKERLLTTIVIPKK